MSHEYYIYIRESNITRTFPVCGCEAAFHAYKSAETFVDAVGMDATVDLVDGDTGELLATTYDFFN